MECDLQVITRDQIPSDIYLSATGDEKDWRFIHLGKFKNGLLCIYGSGYPEHPKTLIETTKDEMDYVIKTENPDILQQYYYDNFSDFKSYKDCIKIWDYYHNNKKLIDEVYYTYFTKNGKEITNKKIDHEMLKKYICKYCRIYFDKAIEKICDKVLNEIETADNSD